MTRSDRLALLLSLLALLVSWWMAANIFENMGHIEDEHAYIWQARVIARGQLTTPSPVEAEKFLVPFVIDYQGQRFGKYPLGWPVMLSFGIRLGLRGLVNPLLAAIAV